MISKLCFISLAQAGFGYRKNHTEDAKIKYDPDNEDAAYIYDRSHGDDDVHRRKRTILEWLEWEFPSLNPHHDSDPNDLHAIDKDHLVDEAFRLSF